MKTKINLKPEILGRLDNELKEKIINMEAKLSEIQIAKNENNLLDMISEEGI
jgi:hypothetical protein